MWKKYAFILVPAAGTLLCSLLFFTSLDNRVFDLFLGTVPSLTEDDSVLIITVDDNAIANVGIFPWTRDILADAIVFLREMGADTVVFDLSYPDRSPMRIDPEYVQNTLPGILDNEFLGINNSVAQVLDALSTGALRPSDLGEYKEQLFEHNQLVRNTIGEAVSFVSRDVDEYFARSLAFFGKAYLTLTMTPDSSSTGGTENMLYLKEHVALKNISAAGDTLTPNEAGILPPIAPLLNSAGGAGFVNALPDKDGYRRRIHLVLKHGDDYYGHLALTALREMIGSPEIVVTNTAITLKGANIRGTVRDIRIPRSRDGTVLIKWPKKPFVDYNILSSWQLIRYKQLEEEFVRNLRVMESSGFFYYLGDVPNPLDAYTRALHIREESPLEQGRFEDYRKIRREYLEAAETFLGGPAETLILEDVAGNGDLENFVRALFGAGREQFDTLMDIRRTVGEKVQGSLSVIGVNATSMTDNGMITFEERFPNVGIYAAAANMILAGEFLDDIPRIVSLLIALALSLGLGILIHRLDVGKSIAAGILAMILSATFFLLFFIITKRYLGAAVPFISVTLTFLSLQAINFFSTTREKSFLRSAFSRYLAPQVIEEILQDPSKLNLGGEERKMTALFTDIRGFSTISEYLSPADLVSLLNIYLTDMSNIILENRGTVDKYEGDAIIAFFGAPVHMEEHAVLACRTAIQIKKAETRLNQQILDESASPLPPFTRIVLDKTLDSPPLFTRIGINTGDMIVGNMGTPDKMNYTIMGHSVNLASRLEGVNKQFNTGGILISEYTKNEIGDTFVTRRLDRVRVVGINTAIQLYELLEEQNQAPTALQDFVQNWEKALLLYENRQFLEAKKLFKVLTEKRPEDPVAKLYLNWSEQYFNSPPNPDWGVYNLTQK
ncbi:CHASE2 domain-containing protein [Treponema primitia]|uniref:CHASE2 domain-containing protein n=1 Tax=Treponema primitia TaxID=88058 RepID=UPI0002554E06|nr:CHASE2 domain-containing protein [Treponema primitia]